MPSHPKRSPALACLALVAVLAASGCQTSPDLAVYREGLHQVDEPLYQAHLLLMDDAVKASLRTDADRQVVQQGIAAARALYQQSAGTPTTAPSE